MKNNLDHHWSAYYDQSKDFRLINWQTISKFLSRVEPSLPKTCLDIGCGTGQLTRELNHRGYTCWGIDISSSAITIAKSLTTSKKLNYTVFDIETDDSNKLPGQPYSLITCKLVYAFIKDKSLFLEKVSSLLKDGGTFVIITPLGKNVPPEKTKITVSQDKTSAELYEHFSKVEIYEDKSMLYFVCSKLAPDS